MKPMKGREVERSGRSRRLPGQAARRFAHPVVNIIPARFY